MKKNKKLILIRGGFDLDNKIITLLKKEGLDFEIVDIFKLVSDGINIHSNILVIPYYLYNLLDKCMSIKIDTNKLNTILIYDSPYNIREEKYNLKSLNVLDCININLSSDKIINNLMKHY